MKKYYFLIIVALILGLVLTGCLLSNVGQIPATDQSEVSSIVKNSNNTNIKCVDFEGTELERGDSVEGMSTVHPLLNIQLEGVVDKDLVLIENGTLDSSNVAYYAGAGIANGCLNGTYGFGCPAFDSSGARIDRLNDEDKIIFEFPDGITVSNFSVEMFDYGDFYPYGAGDRLVTLKAYYDSIVDVITYSGPASVDGTYDACHLSGNGKHKFEVSGSGIYKVELEFGTGIDPAIGFDDICFTLEIPIDIKPQSCPNPLNTKSKGVTPVAILGTADFDVTIIDPVTVTLAGAYPLRWDWEDVATPFKPYTGKEDCDLDCNTLGPDNYLDLTLKFDTQELLTAIESLYAIGTVESFEVNEEELNILESGVDDQVTTITGEILAVGACLVIQLEGLLLDGTPIIGEDVVRILEKGKK